MVSVTDRAAAVLAHTLREGEAGAELGFRIVASGPGAFALTIDAAREGDHVVRRYERTVLVMEPWMAVMLNGAVLDIEVDDDGASLRLLCLRSWPGELC